MLTVEVDVGDRAPRQHRHEQSRPANLLCERHGERPADELTAACGLGMDAHAPLRVLVQTLGGEGDEACDRDQRTDAVLQLDAGQAVREQAPVGCAMPGPRVQCSALGWAQQTRAHVADQSCTTPIRPEAVEDRQSEGRGEGATEAVDDLREPRRPPRTGVVRPRKARPCHSGASERADRRVVCGAVASGDPFVEFTPPLAFQFVMQAPGLLALIRDVHEGCLAVTMVGAIEAVDRAMPEQRLLHETWHRPAAGDAALVIEDVHALRAAHEHSPMAEQSHGCGARVVANPRPDARAEVVAVHEEKGSVVCDAVEHAASLNAARRRVNGGAVRGRVCYGCEPGSMRRCRRRSPVSALTGLLCVGDAGLEPTTSSV
ncbi:hypothetical protein [Microbacterium esteraromaticum]|uniref:hypothetical protein n=1 Tax=Microbacterium esteraromaticum TaxID=57043 RepID=UPI0015F35C4A|nr:hypothetical protein [Microbacterium esteraromaticum]